MDEWMQPSAKEMYIAEMGWHFNEKACKYAVQYLKDRSGKPIKPYSKEEVDELLKKQNVTLEKNRGWDYVYVASMAKSDMDGSPLADDKSIANYIKNLLDDIQANIFKKAKDFRDSHIYECNDYEDFKARVKNGGFFLCHWDGTAETEARIKEETQATIRCVPYGFEQTPGVDMVSGKPAVARVLMARSY